MKIFKMCIVFLNILFFGVLDARLVFGDKDSTLEIMPTGTLQLFSTDRMDKITGTIKTSSPQSITYGDRAGKLFFDAGTLIGAFSDDIFEINLTGTYDPTSTYSLILDGAGNTFNMITPGAISERLKARGTGSTVMGYPAFQSQNAILSTSDITMAADGEVGTNINANGGSVNLGSDLILKDDVKITDSGTINFQEYNLATGQKDLMWTDTLLLVDAKNISLGGKSSIRGQWIFKNDAHVIGNGFTLDLSGGGNLWIKKNTTVQMTGVNIKGLGSGLIVFEDPITSKLQLDDSYIDMDNDYTVTYGVWYASAPVTVFTRDKVLTFDVRGTLSVDRTTVFYDTLGFNDTNNIAFISRGKNFGSLNGGSVRKVRSLQVGDYLINTDVILDRTFVVSPLKRLEIQDNAIVDGDGFAYMFVRQPGEMIFSVSANKRAKFINILLKDFPIDGGAAVVGANSQLIFGDNTQVEIGDSGTLTTTWFVDGSVVINGNGKQLELANTAEIILRPGASLLLDNMTLRGVSVNQIRCMDNYGTVSWGNVTCKMDGDFTYTQGMMTLLGQLDLVGTATFGYASSKEFNITRFGKLFVDTDAAFKYMPSTTNRDLIVMDDGAAEIHLNGGSLISTTTGMRLTKGTLYVDAHSYVQNKDAVGEQESIAFGDGTPANDLTVFLGSSATMDVLSGRVIYDNQE